MSGRLLLDPSLRFLFSGAWFSGAIVAFMLYAILMRPSSAAIAEGEVT